MLVMQAVSASLPRSSMAGSATTMLANTRAAKAPPTSM